MTAFRKYFPLDDHHSPDTWDHSDRSYCTDSSDSSNFKYFIGSIDFVVTIVTAITVVSILSFLTVFKFKFMAHVKEVTLVLTGETLASLCFFLMFFSPPTFYYIFKKK